jgi:hypothetical protein
VPRVFVSHAAADLTLVDEFVDQVLRIGCGLTPDTLFYSSARDTGVPSGEDLLHHVRTQLDAGDLVVALVTPTFPTRPVCVAELGAAWARAGQLFPLLSRNVARPDLDGVMVGLAAHYLDDGDALDELHDRVKEATGVAVQTTTWGPAKQKWLARVEALTEGLSIPEVTPPEEVAKLRQELADVRTALGESESERAEQVKLIADLKAAKDTTEVAAILAPRDAVEQFEQLLDDAQNAMKQVQPVVREAIRMQRVKGGLPVPSSSWDDYFEEAPKAVDDGYLTDLDDGLLRPNADWPKIAKAVEAVNELGEFLELPPEDFHEWFVATYEVPPDLTMLQVMKALKL